ncbi:MAG TPA: GNAT family N-acetyltransferase [Acidimicrobiales bacterium]
MTGGRCRTLRSERWKRPTGRWCDRSTEGIATGQATFEGEPPDWEGWNSSHSVELRFVVVDVGRVVGWAAASPISEQCCYAGVVEQSVYVSQARRGQGIGGWLLRFLVSAAEKTGNWTVQAGIFPENIASVSLHEACGFRLVGRRERLGQLQGVRKDVLLYERPTP